MLKLIYTFFLGVLLAIFVGVGISAFYPGPASPPYPIELNNPGKELTADQTIQQHDYDVAVKQYDLDKRPYNRNVSIMTLAAATLFLVVSLVFEKKIRIIADGIMLGGLFTLLYSIGRGFASQDNKYVFIVVTVGLALVIYLGYHRFVVERGKTKLLLKNNNK